MVLDQVIDAWRSRDLAVASKALETFRQSTADNRKEELSEAGRRAVLVESDPAARAFCEGDFLRGTSQCCARLKRACGEDVDDVSCAFTDGFADGVVVDVLTEALRFARNLCVRPWGQHLFASLGNDDLFDVLCRLDKLYKGSSFDQWREKIVTLGCVLVTTLLNLIVGNSVTRRDFCSKQSNLSAITQALLFACDVENNLLLSCLGSFVYTLFVDDDEHHQQQQLVKLVEHPELLVVLLQAGGLALAHLNSNSSGNDDNDPAMISFHAHCVWLVGLLANQGHGSTLISLFKSESSGKLEDVVFSLWLGHRLDEADEQEKPGPKEREHKLVEQSFNALTELYRESALEMGDDSGGGGDKLQGREDVLVNLLGSYATDKRVYANEPNKSRLLFVLLDRLEFATANTAIIPSGLRGKMVRAISNLCYLRKVNQDVVRERPGGLFVILNQCNFDENSQFLREWGVFAVRNLCEGNPENQQAIAELRVQGSVNNSLIEKAGMRVEFTPEGKPKLVRL